ncbi:PREDICTED: glycerol-3-phosphate dehydrogenase [NAD(+)], cytoplasmic-like isoform X2 [Ceratosolen solmsi marchali]|uniref:Glycerol-3-phosphate dehydrogenase [NAD(+)] n=1 Tax=Ceratosolen solmsi marchali TaxID=326594 RepID=A0AAJ6YIW8_9HYME|nr:PREDICTED: glycerol-3-phosphate dehydrogenase [NAD(+)], cytoplasmic-like isoform X2 [Ceratosolen solmsi marchali]
MPKIRICIIGSGNWGSAIAKIIGINVKKFEDKFEEEVMMYVYEEMIEGKKLTDIINETHENVKYLPGHKLSPNIIAVPDVVEAAKNADILIFVVPHQFVPGLCTALLGKIKSSAVSLSLIKGFTQENDTKLKLISKFIEEKLKIPCSVLMGANLSNEVASDYFCETTIGCKDKIMGAIMKDCIQTENFRVRVVEEIEAVEICGALKNIVACAAGFVDGLDLGDNTKAAVIRLGLMEIVNYVKLFYGKFNMSIFFESCGIADLITTCYGGRNRRVCEQFVKTGKTIKELEDELLNGQKLQGPLTAEEVYGMLKDSNSTAKFPLFATVHRICNKELKPNDLIEQIRNHPEYETNV